MEDASPPHFGHFFYALRKSLVPNRAKFVASSGVNYRHLYRIEDEWTTPRGFDDTMEKLAKGVGLSLAELERRWRASPPVPVPIRRAGPVPRSTPKMNIPLPMSLGEKIKAEADRVGMDHIEWIIGAIEGVLRLQVMPDIPGNRVGVAERRKAATPKHRGKSDDQKRGRM